MAEINSVQTDVTSASPFWNVLNSLLICQTQQQQSYNKDHLPVHTLAAMTLYRLVYMIFYVTIFAPHVIRPLFLLSIKV